MSAARTTRETAEGASAIYERDLDSAALVLPVHFGWIGHTARVFSADGSTAIVVANRAVGEQVVAALNGGGAA